MYISKGFLLEARLRIYSIFVTHFDSAFFLQREKRKQQSHEKLYNNKRIAIAVDPAKIFLDDQNLEMRGIILLCNNSTKETAFSTKDFQVAQWTQLDSGLE